MQFNSHIFLINICINLKSFTLKMIQKTLLFFSLIFITCDEEYNKNVHYPNIENDVCTHRSEIDCIQLLLILGIIKD